MKTIILDKEFDHRLRYASIWHLVEQYDEDGNTDRFKSVLNVMFDQDEKGNPNEPEYAVRQLAYRGFVRINDRKPFPKDFYEEIRGKARKDPDMFIHMWSYMI